jgi:hypothetical protein
LELGLPGIGFELGERRVYPRGREASHVLGFVGIDNQGLAGIEYGQEDALKGGAALARPDLTHALDRDPVHRPCRDQEPGMDRFLDDRCCTSSR